MEITLTNSILAIYLKKTILLTGVFLMFGGTIIGQGTITNPSRGQVIISEFRLRGPNGANDEFVELYNTTSSTVVVTDQSNDVQHQLLCNTTPPLGGSPCGWALVDLANRTGGGPKFIIPNGIQIPPYGHYLITNNGTSGYSLTNYAAADGSYTPNGTTISDIADNTGIALFKTSFSAAFDGSETACVGGGTGVSAPCILDGVGFGNNAEPYREGTGLTPVTAIDDEHSYVRKFLTTGFPQDTNNNAQDFMLISTNATTFNGCSDPLCNQYNTQLKALLGAPGPENLNSPINRTPTMRSSLIDSGGSLANGNAERNTNAFDYTRPLGGTISFPAGTLSLRRRITNTTGAPVTRIRIRINSLSTLNSPGYSLGGAQADVRAINSDTVQVTLTMNNQMVTAQGVTLEENPPDQPEGGGYNATLDVPIGGGLADTQSVVVNIRFGVKQGGQFKFSYTVEVLP